MNVINAYEEKVKELDILQRRASLLIQAFSFFATIQQEMLLRNQIIEEYKTVLGQIMPKETPDAQ